MADFSRARRNKAVSILRSERDALRLVPREARELYAVGMLICDKNGRLTKSALHEAAKDPSVLQSAKNLLREAKV